MRQPALNHAPVGQGLHRALQGDAGVVVVSQPVANMAVAQVGASSVLAAVFTASVVRKTLVHIVTTTPVCVEAVTRPAVALVAPGVIGAVLLTARAACLTFIKVQTGLEVIGELVAMVTAADGTEGGVLTEMRAASISCLTTINDLHFNTEASPAVRAQLIPGVTDAGKGARGVSAAMGTPCLSRLTFIDVFTASVVPCKAVSTVTLTVGASAIIAASVHATSILVCTWVPQLAAFPISSKLVVVSTAALEMGLGQLHTLLLASAIADRTRQHSKAGASICVETEAWVTLAVVGSPCVDAPVLATSVVDLAFVNFWSQVSHIVSIISTEASVAISAEISEPIVSLHKMWI